VWPNPASSIASVKLFSRSGGTCNVRIANPLGQTVLTERFVVKQGINVLPVKVAGLDRGIYHLSIEGTSLNERINVLLRKE
ncbi:MAG: T9SS type A sorting domain-containing protein, partial [Chitinophagaceae bacterium]